jgi:hypothetical protein
MTRIQSSALLISVLTLSLAACSRTVVKESKETVTEKPVVTEERIIVEQPPATKEKETIIVK